MIRAVKVGILLFTTILFVKRTQRSYIHGIMVGGDATTVLLDFDRTSIKILTIVPSAAITYEALVLVVLSPQVCFNAFLTK